MKFPSKLWQGLMQWDAAIAAFLSFLTAIAMIWLMMKGLTKFSFMPYVVYRLILGGILVWVLYF